MEKPRFIYAGFYCMCMIITVPTASLDFALGKLSMVYHKELGRARGLRMLSITVRRQSRSY